MLLECEPFFRLTAYCLLLTCRVPPDHLTGYGELAKGDSFSDPGNHRGTFGSAVCLLLTAYCLLLFHCVISLRHSICLEGITVRIFAANAPPPHLQRRYVDGDDEQLSQLAGRRLQRTHAVPGVLRALEKQASVSPRV